jgi:3-oxoacyl-[acyl-carrier-protein] synthase-3
MGRTIITGTGRYIPGEIITNRDFAAHDFYDEHHEKIQSPPEVIAAKFEEITGISERRYAEKGLDTSDMALIAAKIAIEDSGIDPETLDQIIFAHNFGNVVKHTIQMDAIPALASRLKQQLKIQNPNCVAYDILFGCPGWLQAMIQADAFFKAGIAKKALIIGSETLSRVIDPYDRDSMIFSDGAGATILEYHEDISDDNSGPGILGCSVQSHCIDEAYYIYYGKSNFPDSDPRVRYIKMKGRKVYEYAIKHVPAAMKECLDKSGIDITQVKKVFIHQANEKMDEGIIKLLYRLYQKNDIPKDVMPMSIHKLGNSSVATVPTVLDLVKRGDLPPHELHKGDIILFASVGAGMNINAVCYRW